MIDWEQIKAAALKQIRAEIMRACGEIGRHDGFRQRYYIAKLPAAARQVKFEQKN